MRPWNLVVVALLAACGHKSEPSAGGTGTASTGGAGSAGSAVVAAPPSDAAGSAALAPDEVRAAKPPEVSLTKAGAEPRRAFAYAPHGGQRSATFVFDLAPADAPRGMGAGFTLKATIQAPAQPVGDYEVRVDDSKAILPKDLEGKTGGEAAVIASMGGQYIGVAARLAADAQGRATLVRTSNTLVLQPSLLWVLHPFVVPVPAAPIGLGATWTAKQPVTMMDGVEGETAWTYEVTAINGDALTVKLRGTTTWRSGAAVPTPETRVETLSGTVTVKPSDVLAQTGSVSSTLDLEVTKVALRVELK